MKSHIQFQNPIINKGPVKKFNPIAPKPSGPPKPPSSAPPGPPKPPSLSPPGPPAPPGPPKPSAPPSSLPMPPPPLPPASNPLPAPPPLPSIAQPPPLPAPPLPRPNALPPPPRNLPVMSELTPPIIPLVPLRNENLADDNMDDTIITDKDMDMSMMSTPGGDFANNDLGEALKGMRNAHQGKNMGRRMTLLEQLQSTKLKPAVDPSKRKQTLIPTNDPMANILEQIRMRKEALDSGGNIIKKSNPNHIDEESLEGDDSDPSFD